MPNSAALAALICTYRDEIRWLTDAAEQYQRENQVVATYYFHRAEKLQALMEQYERVCQIGSPFVQTASPAPNAIDIGK